MVKRPSSKSAKPVAPPPNRYVCVHGHFYQPPRENPWLETVEVQDSAAPYHDWNERIAAECYAPNGASRITDRKNEIVRIVNNYARMSFNFGPTLLKWLADKTPRTYRRILDADIASAHRYGGHGSSVAQNYNHIIMPLASRRDALTQIRWGIADFESRFNRRPEGMWLAETAVNRSVLDMMAAEGIQFTILAPHQCARVRNIPQPPDSPDPLLPTDSAEASNSPSNNPWTETPSATVDTTHPYRINLDQGRSIAVFFYDGPTSRAVAFEGLLNSGEAFGSRLLDGFKSNGSTADTPQLSHIATDGESYGHHHKYGEMALSYAMHWIEDNGHARLTNYGEFLEKFPPAVGGRGRRRHLLVLRPRRRALALQLRLQRRQARLAPAVARTPPRSPRLPPRRDRPARRGPRRTAAHRPLGGARRLHRRRPRSHRRLQGPLLRPPRHPHPHRPNERVTVLELMELERHTQLMYTSCGWFFDELSGIETIQIIAYAGRVLQLASKLFGPPGAALEDQFLAILARAKSNLPDMGDGADIYRKYVTGIRIGLDQVGAHYAISSIFRSYPEDGELFCFDVHRDSQESFTSGRGKVALGRANIRSRITEEAEDIFFAVLHLGDQNLSAAVRRYSRENARRPRRLHRLLHRRRHRHPPRQSPRRHPPHRPLLRHPRLLAHLALRRRAAPHPAHHPRPHPRRDGRLPAQNLRRSRLAAPLPHRIRHGRPARPRHRRQLRHQLQPPPRHRGRQLRRRRDRSPLHPRHRRPDHPRHPVLSFAAGRAHEARHGRPRSRRQHRPRHDGRPPHRASPSPLGLRSMPFDVNLWQAQNIWNDLFRRSDKNHWSPEWKLAFKKLGEALYISVDQLVIDEGVGAP